MNVNTLTLGVLLSLVTITNAQAQHNNTLDHDVQTISFDPMVITANKTITKTSDIIAETTVIDAIDLERYKGQTVLDVLQNQSGFNIKQQGGMGTLSNFYLRGHDSKSILVLIDGVPFKSLTSGQSSLHLLSVENIERIEILHGASGSSIYGSDAVGGVIQIFSKGSLTHLKTTKDHHSTSATATIGYGSHDLQTLSLSGQYHKNNTHLSLGINHVSTEGIDATKETNYAHYPDKDGFKNKSVHLTFTQGINSNMRTGISGQYNKSTSDFDAYPDWQTNKVHTKAHSQQENGAANIFFEFYNELIEARISHGQSIDKSKSFDNAHDLLKSTNFETKQKHTRIENKFKIPKDKGVFIVGNDNIKQTITSTTEYDRSSRDSNNIFAGYHYNGDVYDFQANYRINDDSQFGKHNTYSLGAAISPIDGTRFGMSYSTGFRSPTFNDLYYPGYANPKLKPETSKVSELFLELTDRLHRTRISAYQSNVTNKLAYNDNAKKTINNDTAKISGINIDSNWKVNGFVFGINYDYQDSAVTKGKYKNKVLVQSPQDKTSAYVGYTHDTYDVRLEHQYTGSRYENADNSTKLDGYKTLNVSGSYFFTPSITGTVRINNLTSEDYETSKDYNTDDVNFLASLSFEF